MLYSRSFLVMALANMFTMASISSFFLLPLFITHHGGTEADIGILMIAFLFGFGISAIILGYAGKWFGFQTLFFIAGLPLFIGLFLFRFQWHEK